MFQRIFLFLAGIMVIMTSGCVILPNKEIIYKDSDVEVVRHESFAMLADTGSISYQLIALGHNYMLSDWIDYSSNGCKGFVRTPDGSAIIFITKSPQKPQAGMVTGVVHVIDFKSKSDIEVPLAIKYMVVDAHIFVKSYDGKKIELFMNSSSYAVSSGDSGIGLKANLEIDLEAKRVTKFDNINNSDLKSTLAP